MTRLEQLISDLEYITSGLRALREIHASGSCNDCKQKSLCEYEPDWGERVRYNCPFYQDAGVEADPPKIDGGTVADFVAYLNREFPKWYARQPFDDLMYAVRKVAKDFIEEYGE